VEGAEQPGDTAADQFGDSRGDCQFRRAGSGADGLRSERQIGHRAGGTGTAYLYDAMADTFTVSNRVYTQTTIAGYFGPLAAAPDGSYYLTNGLVLNSSLSVLGGSS